MRSDKGLGRILAICYIDIVLKIIFLSFLTLFFKGTIALQFFLQENHNKQALLWFCSIVIMSINVKFKNYPATCYQISISPLCVESGNCFRGADFSKVGKDTIFCKVQIKFFQKQSYSKGNNFSKGTYLQLGGLES